MLGLLKRFLSFGYSRLENLKGKRVFEKQHSLSVSNSVKVISVDETSVTIFVTRTDWFYRYSLWLLPKKKFSTFKVSSFASHNASQRLIDVCELEITIPALLPWFFSDEMQADAVVMAYVDVLFERMKKAGL